jgi:hypothetical protein
LGKCKRWIEMKMKHGREFEGMKAKLHAVLFVDSK